MQAIPEHHRARRTDPGTSHAAARKAERFAASQAGRILSAIRVCGQATAHSISCYTGLSIEQVDRRLPDLKEAGLAEVVRENGQDKKRGPYRVWRAVETAQ